MQPLGITPGQDRLSRPISSDLAGVSSPPGTSLVQSVVHPQRMETWLTVREVAGLLKVSTATVYRLVAEGRLRHVRVSNAIRVPAQEIQAIVAGCSGADGRLAVSRGSSRRPGLR